MIPSQFILSIMVSHSFLFFFQQHSCDFVSFPTCVLSFSGFRFYFVFSFFLVLDSILCLVFFQRLPCFQILFLFSDSIFSGNV